MRCDWFKFKGIDCRTYGIRVSDRPPIMFPQERVSFTNVPGRSGTLSVTEGEDVYNDMIFSFNCVLKNSERASEIAAWLKGSGDLVVPFRTGGFYKARYTGQLNLAQLVKGRENVSFSVEFRVEPFFYLDSGNVSTIFHNSVFTLYPIGNIIAEPTIEFKMSSNDAVIRAGGNTMLLEGIPVGTVVTIDCINRMVYSYHISQNLCDKASGQFPTLNTDVQSVSCSITGMNTTYGVVVYPNWRML